MRFGGKSTSMRWKKFRASRAGSRFDNIVFADSSLPCHALRLIFRVWKLPPAQSPRNKSRDEPIQRSAYFTTGALLIMPRRRGRVTFLLPAKAWENSTKVMVRAQEKFRTFRSRDVTTNGRTCPAASPEGAPPFHNAPV